MMMMMMMMFYESPRCAAATHNTLIIVAGEFSLPGTVWNPNSIKHIKSLETLKERAARWILHRHCRTLSVNDMLTALDWPSLQPKCRGARLPNFYN